MNEHAYIEYETTFVIFCLPGEYDGWLNEVVNPWADVLDSGIVPPERQDEVNCDFCGVRAGKEPT